MPKKSTAFTIVALLLLLLAFWAAPLQDAEAQPLQATPVPQNEGFRDHGASLDPQPITLSPVTTDTSIADLVARVDGDRWHADVDRLARFGAEYPNEWGTRYSYSAGNHASRDWISDTFASLGWTSSTDSFFYFGATGYNVVGEIVGHSRPEDIYIVGAHYDSVSRNSDVWTLAPGAEDNASGTAALLEIARVLQDQTPASTIRLIAFSGEEQGLIGSRDYVSDLKDVTYELDNVKGMYNLDMIGFTSDPENHHVVLESSHPEYYPWMGDFRDHLASMARTYTDLQISTSDYPGGSDHAPFLWEEVPAVLLIGAELRTYRDLGHYHSKTDLPENVVPSQGAEIIKAVVAALASKAGIVCVYADVTCDGVIDLADLSELAGHWRLVQGEDGYADRFDLNNDQQVNVIDLQLSAQSLANQ